MHLPLNDIFISSWFSHTVFSFAIKPVSLTVREASPVPISNFPALLLNHRAVQFMEKNIHCDTFSQRHVFGESTTLMVSFFFFFNLCNLNIFLYKYFYSHAWIEPTFLSARPAMHFLADKTHQIPHKKTRRIWIYFSYVQILLETIFFSLR